MNDLILALRKVLATNFALYLKTHQFHWNVEGKNFTEYHEFWSTIYQDLFAQSDVLAEFIRQEGEYAPGSLSVYGEMSDVRDEELYLPADAMFKQFLSDNAALIILYQKLYAVAEQNKAYQISDFCAQRLGAHKKHAWMARSIIKA